MQDQKPRIILDKITIISIIIVAVIVIVVAVGIITTKSDSTTNTSNSNNDTANTAIPTRQLTPFPTDSPTPTPTPVPKDINGFPEDAQAVTVADLDKAPSQYEGMKVTFTCTVAGFAKDSSGNAAAVNCSDPSNFSSLIQVDTSAFDMTKIRQGDTVKFYGLGAGSATGKNAFGGNVSESLVSGMYINDLTSGYKE